MKFLDYKQMVLETKLDDYATLLNIGRKYKKIEDIDSTNCKIAVIGTPSIQLFVSVFRALLCKYDIKADIYEGEYNGINMAVFDENSDFYQFDPAYVVIIPDYRDVVGLCPKPLASEDEVMDQVKKAAGYYIRVWEKIHEKLPNCQILMGNLVEPVEDSMGNLEVNYLFSKSQFFRLVNIELIKAKPSFVNLVDLDKLSANLGKLSWFDESAYFLNKSAFALEYIGFVADLFARQFEALIGRPKKCIVLDLDNTLWGGVVGDLGYDGINLDPNDAEGEAYIAFQRYLLSLKERGIILAVSSKNDVANAKEPFEKNENMVLKLADISCFRANWEDKASNIKAIAAELNIGVDSLVFFDDNPTERELVKSFLPEVRVIDVPEDPALYTRALDQAFCFDLSQLTKEDIDRVQTYSDNAGREELLSQSANYDDFLKKLEMEVKWAQMDDTSKARFTQLTNKSNQFNVRTCRYTEAQIDEMASSDDYELYTISLKDRFSNYGVIACVVLKYSEDTCFIENLVMSCRVLKKSVENYILTQVAKAAASRGVGKLEAEYIKSAKNGMVRDLFDSMGFTLTDESDENKHYVLDEKSLKGYSLDYFMKEE